MFKWRSIHLILCATLSWAGPTAWAVDDAALISEPSIEFEVDDGVKDPRGDESPDPREEDLVCENVVCGDEGPTCTTGSCGKPAQ